MINEELIRSALKAVKYPGFSRDIVSFGLIENISVQNDSVSVRIRVTTSDGTVPMKIKDYRVSLGKEEKPETEKAVVFHFKNYRENLKFQYMFVLADAIARMMSETLISRSRT